MNLPEGVEHWLKMVAIDNFYAADQLEDAFDTLIIKYAKAVTAMEEEAYHRGASDRKVAKTEGLLVLALAYVEAYAGRFPDNVRLEHLKAFRKWRKANEK